MSKVKKMDRFLNYKKKYACQSITSKATCEKYAFFSFVTYCKLIGV